jgi:hypothetical protein
LLCPVTFGSHFYPYVSNALSWHLLLLKQKKPKQNKLKKTIEKKRNAEKGESFPLSSRSTLSLLAPASTLPLLPSRFYPFVSNIFSWHLFVLK